MRFGIAGAEPVGEGVLTGAGDTAHVVSVMREVAKSA
jgi:hypothetical protein